MDRLSALETESVRSGRSDRTDLRSVRSVPHNYHGTGAALQGQYVPVYNAVVGGHPVASPVLSTNYYAPLPNSARWLACSEWAQQLPSSQQLNPLNATNLTTGAPPMYSPAPIPAVPNHLGKSSSRSRHHNSAMGSATGYRIHGKNNHRGGVVSADERVNVLAQQHNPSRLSSTGVEPQPFGQMSSPAGHQSSSQALLVHGRGAVGLAEFGWDQATAVTSETGRSVDDLQRAVYQQMVDLPQESTAGADCARFFGTVLSILLTLCAFLSPVAMVLLPRLQLDGWQAADCTAICQGLLIGFGFKLVILLIGVWALFFRHPKSTMPRVFIFRALVLFLTFVLTFAFWLFYIVRVWQEQITDYSAIVQFAESLVNALLFLHYLAVILLELRQLQPCYIVTVVRSPDGQMRHYSMGQLSVQRAAVWVLEHYYRDFDAYNPYLELASSRRGAGAAGSGSHHKSLTSGGNSSTYKFYDVDGISAPIGSGAGGTHSLTPQTGRSRSVMTAPIGLPNGRGTGGGAKSDGGGGGGGLDRFYCDEEWERRVRRRKARLQSAAEEAFSHIRRLEDEKAATAIPMEATEAAQAIFPTMARALQKYLRITRQQPKYKLDSILEHLTVCICNDMGSKAFVEKYLTQGPVIMNDLEYKRVQNWILVSDVFVSRAVQDGSVFRLRQGDVSLLVSVRKLPHFNLTEEVVDARSHKFTIRLQSETSV